MTYEDANQISIRDYLEQRGIKFESSNFCSSPFSSDSSASFKYYPNTNSFFDWSQGFGGGTISLVMKLENLTGPQALRHLAAGQFSIVQPNYKQYKDKENDFSIDKYVNLDDAEIAEINAYAANRGLREQYYPGMYMKRRKDKWMRVPAVMYVHVDENLNPCGAKFRKIRDDEGVRFSARGRQGMYILENILVESFETTLYIVEGESSANSLWEFFKSIERSVVVMSFGSVGSKPSKLPEKFKDLPRRLIIDYDGSEELFNIRIKQYEDLEAEPIKLILPKGEDINSLYVNNKMYLIKNLIN